MCRLSRPGPLCRLGRFAVQTRQVRCADQVVPVCRQGLSGAQTRQVRYVDSVFWYVDSVVWYIDSVVRCADSVVRCADQVGQFCRLGKSGGQTRQVRVAVWVGTACRIGRSGLQSGQVQHASRRVRCAARRCVVYSSGPSWCSLHHPRPGTRKPDAQAQKQHKTNERIVVEQFKYIFCSVLLWRQ